MTVEEKAMQLFSVNPMALIGPDGLKTRTIKGEGRAFLSQATFS
jgi:hypothetical protein